MEELPKQFRCVSVDLLARRPVLHRRGLVADVVACSMRLPVMYAPLLYDCALHVDGGVLDDVPVTALAGSEGPLIAVSVTPGENAAPNPKASTTTPRRCPASATPSCAP